MRFGPIQEPEHALGALAALDELRLFIGDQQGDLRRNEHYQVARSADAAALDQRERAVTRRDLPMVLGSLEQAIQALESESVVFDANGFIPLRQSGWLEKSATGARSAKRARRKKTAARRKRSAR